MRTKVTEVHATSIIGVGAHIGANTSIGPYCHVYPGVFIGDNTVLADRVTVGPRVRIGSNVDVAAGVHLDGDLELHDGVAVGPNTAVIGPSPGRSRSQTVVNRGASIGANATIEAGVTIGAYATVAAGTVVTRDVPPYATVEGNPAQIVGYESSPQFEVTRHLRTSEIDDSAFPIALGKATLLRYPRVDDIRGSLTFGEVGVQLPFAPLRYFLVYGVPTREVRGEHAHHTLHELVVCVSGECAIAIDDGYIRAETVLDRPDVALHIPPKVWRSHYNYSLQAVLLSLCSEPYDEDDYIRSYDLFQQELDGG